jgi:hypothetical protein
VVIAGGELIALFLSDGARTLVAPLNETALASAGALAVVKWMRRRALRIIGHESHDSPLNQSGLAPALRAAGLSPSGPGFRL